MAPDTSLLQRRKLIKGTNVIVQKSAPHNVQDEPRTLLRSISADDKNEVAWWSHTLRPERNLIHPSDAFLHSIKALRPAARFNTFDPRKARLRRLVKQEMDKRKFLERRKREVAPTAAMKASANPHKVPRAGGRALAHEVRFLSSGKKLSKKDVAGGTGKPYFHKWKKQKLLRIGKGL